MLPTTTTKYSQGSLAEQMFIDIFSSPDCWLTNTSLTRFELLKEKMFKSSSIIRDPRQQWPPSLLNKSVRVYCQQFLSFPKITRIPRVRVFLTHKSIVPLEERQLHNKSSKLMKMGKYPRIAFLTPHHLKAFFTTTSRHQECLSLTICICHFSPLTSADTSMKTASKLFPASLVQLHWIFPTLGRLGEVGLVEGGGWSKGESIHPSQQHQLVSYNHR